MLSKIIENKFYHNLDNRYILREVIMNIGLKKIDMQEKVIVKVLLDSNVIESIISLEFAKKQQFKLKKIKRYIYMKDINGSFNKKRLIEHMVEVNIYY